MFFNLVQLGQCATPFEFAAPDLTRANRTEPQQKGGGAFRNGRRCRVSDEKSLKQCLAGMNLDGRDFFVDQLIQLEFVMMVKLIFGVEIVLVN